MAVPCSRSGLAAPDGPRSPRERGAALTLLLIRHAEAGDQRDWDGDDIARPLSSIGHDQASRLVPLWHEQPIKRVLAGPATRCIQTVEPLAHVLGLEVEPHDALGEGNAPEALELIHQLIGDDAALCTHGDVIPQVLQALESEGTRILSEWKWRKCSTWVLHAEDGRLTHATYVPRPI